MKNYQVVFKRDGKAIGYAELAKTLGQAIDKAIDRTDYELDEVIRASEVFMENKFVPN